MSALPRVQLALNVSDLDAAVDFYGRLFDAEPHKRRPGYANFALDSPPLKLVLIENAAERRQPQPPRRRGGRHRRGDPRPRLAVRRRPRQPHRGRRRLLPRPAGQGLGHRSRRRRLGGLHDPRRQSREAAWSTAGQASRRSLMAAAASGHQRPDASHRLAVAEHRHQLPNGQARAHPPRRPDVAPSARRAATSTA